LIAQMAIVELTSLLLDIVDLKENLIGSCAVQFNQLQLAIQHDVISQPRSSDVNGK